MGLEGNLLFRVDGNSQIGLGHLIRCFALAQMLKDNYEITFFCRTIPGSIENELIGCRFRVKVISDEKDFLKSISSEEIVVIDGYDFGNDFQNSIREKGAKLICIDDLHDKEYVADLIINHCPGITHHQYKATPSTQFALGFDYTLLRPPFLEQAKNKRKIAKSDTILICFGGADPKGLTVRAIKVVSEIDHYKKIIVITGVTFDKNLEFNKLLLNDNRINHRHNLNGNQMLDAMLEADIALVPSSGVLYEALAAGCKVVTGISAENQRYVYENFKKCGIIIDAGLFAEDEIRSALLSGIFINSETRPIIDGKVKERIIKLVCQLGLENHVNLKCASKEDIEITYKWASNPEIRQHSFNRHRITVSEHNNWYLGKISDSSCLYYLALYNSEFIGSIRFDISGFEAVISYLVDPGFQGKGFGLIILKKGLEKLFSETINVNNNIKIKIISGEVMKSNIPSIKSFERFGFVKQDLGNKFRFEKQL